MKVGASSVTGALHQLAERKLINYSPYDLITLTDHGKQVALEVVKRHIVLKEFFTKVLAVEEKEAESAACQMEHAVSKDLLERFTKFIEFTDNCPRAGAKWINGFGYQCESGSNPDLCESCITQTLEEVKLKKINKEVNMGNILKLNKLSSGSRARIVSVNNNGNSTLRFTEMGLTVGSLLKVERVAPLGDPVDISIKGYRISLRKEDLESINVELLED
jgi:DtxR family Mn-dependent transcriptional regulator